MINGIVVVFTCRFLSHPKPLAVIGCSRYPVGLIHYRHCIVLTLPVKISDCSVIEQHSAVNLSYYIRYHQTKQAV